MRAGMGHHLTPKYHALDDGELGCPCCPVIRQQNGYVSTNADRKLHRSEAKVASLSGAD
jgi:hypothetical protein